MNFEGQTVFGPDRAGLVETVREATKASGAWGFSLAHALQGRSLWNSDLWPAIIQGWSNAELDVQDWRKVLSIVSRREFRPFHAHDTANLLLAIVKNEGKPFAAAILDEADAVALKVWKCLGNTDAGEEIDDWLQHAINSPAGVLAEFWVSGLSLRLSGLTGPERVMPDSYRGWFNMAVEDGTANGGFARAVLAGQAGFLFGLDETWVRQSLLPQFVDEDAARFRQAWDGFLVWGHIYPALADALLPAFMVAMERLHKDLLPRRQSFIEHFAALAVFHVTDPTKDLVPALFKYGEKEDRVAFASYIGYMLKSMPAEAKKQLWEAWLWRYWNQRRQAVPSPLTDEERERMLDWLLELDDAYPAAVKLSIDGPPIKLEHSSLLYELRESGLPLRFPEATANLVVFLSCCDLGFQVPYLKDVAVRLVGLADDLRRSLAEALARAGAV